MEDFMSGYPITFAVAGVVMFVFFPTLAILQLVVVPAIQNPVLAECASVAATLVAIGLAFLAGKWADGRVTGNFRAPVDHMHDLSE